MNPNDRALIDEVTGARWVSVADFAAARAVSIRTVKRYIENGQVETRKDGARRLVRPLELAPERDTKGTRSKGHNPGDVSLSVLIDAQKEGHNGDTEGTQAAHAVSLSSDREADFRAEVAFLRAQLEEANRNAGELRAALRASLANQPKQLTAGDSAANTQSARIRPESPQIVDDERRDADMVNRRQNAPEREETAPGETGIDDAELLALCRKVCPQ